MEFQHEHIKLSIIIPAKNEAGRIIETLDSIISFFKDTPNIYEVVVVENLSTDDTSRVVRSYEQKIAHLQLIELGMNCGGKGEAVRAGMLRGKGAYLLIMDADNATRIEEVSAFWQYVDQGYDVVIGSRHVKGSHIKQEQPLFRRILGRVANSLIQWLILPGIEDTQCGFKMFRREVARKLFSAQEIKGWGFDIEVLALAQRWKYNIKEVPVRWYHVGESRLRPIKAAANTLKELFAIFFRIKTGYYEKKLKQKK